MVCVLICPRMWMRDQRDVANAEYILSPSCCLDLVALLCLLPTWCLLMACMLGYQTWGDEDYIGRVAWHADILACIMLSCHSWILACLGMCWRWAESRGNAMHGRSLCEQRSDAWATTNGCGPKRIGYCDGKKSLSWMMLAGLHCACLVLLHVVMSCHLLFFQCLSWAHFFKKMKTSAFLKNPWKWPNFLRADFYAPKEGPGSLCFFFFFFRCI